MYQVYAKPNGGMPARLGVVVSRRVTPQASRRNYSKRLAREVFRAEAGGLAGAEFVVRPRREITRQHSSAARAEIRDLFHRALRQCQARAASRQC
jgi:ribonuclease P protein component